MKKTFIIDTNVLLHDPKAMFSFGENNIIIPIYVVEEVDTFKKELSELGQNARQISRQLDGLRSAGSLAKGITLSNGGVLRVASAKNELPEEISLHRSQDNRILALALEIKQQLLLGKEDVVLITQDINLRIKADAIGIAAENFEPEPIAIDDLYSGYTESEDLNSEKYIKNQFVIDKKNLSHFRFSSKSLKLQPIIRPQTEVWGIQAKNPEQLFAMDLLLDVDVQLVTLVGKAGTGKTLLAIACGLELVSEKRKFQRLLVSRPIFPLGRDLGYLPGTVEEKLNPWMQPIYDNVEFLMSRTSTSFGRHRHKTTCEDLMEIGMLQIEPLTYIRGRSIASQFLIVDEAQNLTPHEVKTIISRAGEGTKVVLTGDPYQIDNPYVDATNNGLVHVVNRFKDHALFGHITLIKGERSILAEAAANLL